MITLSSTPTFDIKGSNIIFEVEIKGYGVNMSNPQIAEEISTTRRFVRSYFQSKSDEISAQNIKLTNLLTKFLSDRKKKLDSDKVILGELVKLVKIPLARKDEDIVKKIYIEKQPFVTRLKPKTPEEDYQLDRDKVLDIIKLINNQCLQFEKTPKTYEKHDEPNLRDHILANLNSIFEGKATGETFNNKGKTDIYLNIDKGNILVCECKFYGGEKLYHQTIDQLLGYLTWRQNFGIMISFCKQKNFSKVVEDAPDIIKKHPTYQNSYSVVAGTHFISKNTLPSDEYKHVEIHHLYYNLYSM